VGQIVRTIIDREEDDFYIGRTEFDSPEVDNEVLISKEIQLFSGQFYPVKIEAAEAFELFGKAMFP
jgi:ribosomal protein S12 methylthiotransferase